MKNRWFTVLFVMLFAVPAFAQKTEVYVPVAEGLVTATANSELDGFPASWAVDGTGLSKGGHKSDNLGRTMWISDVSTSEVRARENTKPGAVWFMCELPKVEKGVDVIQVWNHNQNQHTGRGFRKTYIEYSVDGEAWNMLMNGELDYFIIPEAVGRKLEPVSLTINTGGIDLKYLCLTAAYEGGNHYHNGDAAVVAQAREMNQNVDYYGLSEVGLFRKQKVQVGVLPKIDTLTFKPSQGYVKTTAGSAREFLIEFPEPLYAGGKVTVETPSAKRVVDIPRSPEGILRLEGLFPEGYMDEAVKTTVKLVSPQGLLTQAANIPAARKWTLYFLPHSHLDIGYTHRQDDVMELQLRNFEKAIELARKTKDYPDGARYKWNAEATWTAAGYIEKYKGTQRETEFVEAIRRGDIGLDATLGSILTGISKQEELMHYFDDAHRMSRLTGVEVNTAMMSDVPGQSWGLVTAMAQNGVRYFSSGPNYVPYLGRLGSYGVGLYNLKLGDVPFWWESQSGEEKILYWQTGKGYSMFHGWLMDKLSVCGVEPVWDYLTELEDKQYPYPLTYLRYTIHGDNGPPDEQMPDVIREWNERYESPKFVIGTTKELFTEMENSYGEYLPTYTGDMTPIWEDGAASTARELAMNRESAERLNQSEILWSMLRPASEFPEEELYQAWKYTVLFSEHTWGASASGPEPESQFTKDLWAGKKMYADSADIISRRIFDGVLNSEYAGREANTVTVFNTNLWSRSDVVVFESAADLSGKMLESQQGERVPLQKLSDGRYMFYASEVPPLASSVYRIVKDDRKTAAVSMADGNVLDNGRVRLVVDENTGAISSFTRQGDDYEYVSGGGLNDYLYSGRGGGNPRKVEAVRSITLLENGEVAATLRIESDAPGCRSLLRDVTIYKDIDRVDIVNTVGKLNVYEKENVRFVFPFNFFNPEVSMDLAMSEMRPERDQLVSSNKNFYSVHNGLSVSDINRGIYLSTVDAPFVELDTTTMDYLRHYPAATGWLNAAQVSPTVYSWVMNNRWGTNYKASQEGIAVFRYSLRTYDPNNHDLKRYGAEQARKLVAAASENAIPIQSLFRIKGNDRIELSTIRPSADGDGYVVRLQNMTQNTVNASIEWGGIVGQDTYRCDNMENRTGDFNPDSFWMKPYDCITIKITVK